MTVTVTKAPRKLGSSDPRCLSRSASAACRSPAPTARATMPRASSVIHHAIDHGVNFLDSSDMYGWGHNETLLGKALAGGRRDKVVLATKFGQTQQPGGANGVDGRPAYVKAGLRGEPQAPGRRRDRPLLPAPRRSLGADRGDGRRDGRAGEGGQGAGAGPQRGQARDHPPRPQDASASPRCRANTRCSIARTPRRRSQTTRRARHLLRRLLAARPQPADRRGAAGVRHSRRRRPRPPSALRRRQSRAQPPARRQRSRRWPRPRAARRARSRSPGCWRRAATSCRSPAPSARRASTRISARVDVASSADEVARLSAAIPPGAAAGTRYPEGG